MPWSADRGKSNTTDQHAKSGDDLTAPGGNQTLRQRGIKYGSQRSAQSPQKRPPFDNTIWEGFPCVAIKKTPRSASAMEKISLPPAFFFWKCKQRTVP